MHPRRYMRSKVVELLLAANTAVGDSVFKSRAKPFIDAEGWESQLPAINVAFSTEQTEQYDQAPKNYRRTASIDVSIYAAAGHTENNVDDFVDDVAEQVEIALGRYDWQAEGIDFDINDSRMELVGTPGASIYAVLTISFRMAYYSYLPDAGKADDLEYFLTANQTYQVGEKLSQQTVTLP